MALTNLAAVLTLAATGPGRYSVDKLLGRRLPRPLVAATIVGATALTALNRVRSRPKPTSGPRIAGPRRRR